MRRTQGLGTIFGTLLGAFALVVGCGTKRPPPEGDATYGKPVGGGNGQTFASDAGATKPPGCGMKPDGSQCDCTDVPLIVDPPTIYFVLDRSGSMKSEDRWNKTRVVVAQILRSLGPRANFGAMMFPGPPTVCAPGVEIMPVRNGDPPSSSVDGPTTTALLAVTRVEPAGGTPTAASLAAVLPILQRVGAKSYVILATDGAPNCNSNAACGVDQCQPNIENADHCPTGGPPNCCESPDGVPENCNDAAPTLAAVSALKNAGIPVYVLGLAGTSTYGYVLDQMAVNGGTELPTSPKYYAVNSSNQDAILGAMKKIAARITGTCTFMLRATPSDPALVNVYLDDVVLPYEPANGWTITDKSVTLVGGACERVRNGDVLDVRIIAGCPRVEPR